MTDLPAGWDTVQLDDVADVQLGRQRSPKNVDGPFQRHYLRAANVTWSGLDVSELKQMNFTEEEMSTYRLQPGDILVNEASGSASEVGKPALFSGEVDDCAFQNHLIRLRCHSIETNFLLHFLMKTAVNGEYVRRSQGVGINHLGKKTLAAWPVPKPPAAEQDEIVRILDTQLVRLDTVMGAVQAVRDKAEQFRRSLLHAAFTGQLTQPDPDRAGLPHYWHQKPVGDLVSIQNGYAFKSAWFVDGGVALARGMNIGHGRINWEDLRSVSEEQALDFERFQLCEGDLLLALDRPIISTGLKWAVVTKDDLPCLLLQRVARLRANSAELTQEFLQRWLQSPQFISALSPGRSIGVPHISTKEISAIQIPVPEADEQQEIVRALDTQLARLDRALEVVDRVEVQCGRLRRSLLQAAFTGELTRKWREANV